MKVRCVKLAFVSAALLAAIATSCGTAYANSAAESAAKARLAYATLQKGDVDTAIEQFSSAIESRELEPEVLANALLNRALAFQLKGRHDQAIDDYSSALNLDAMSPSLRSTALYNRGLSQLKLAILPLAIEDFTGSLLLNPKFPQAYFNRGNALRDSGQLLFALSDYERALRFKHPNPAVVYFGSATTYLQLKRPQDAKRAFNAALAMNPQFGEARAQLILLGDETAKAESLAMESDPILTGSVSALAGGTLVTKVGLPKPVELPAKLVDASAGKKPAKKLFTEKLPGVAADDATLTTASLKQPGEEVVVEVEQVPEIPVASAEETSPEMPVKKPVKKQVATANEEISDDSATLGITGAWAVQLSSAGSEDAAWATWKKMQARYKILKSEKPNVIKADLGAKGIFYRIRLGGFDDQASAKKSCAKLKSKGVACYISKTGA